MWRELLGISGVFVGFGVGGVMTNGWDAPITYGDMLGIGGLAWLVCAVVVAITRPATRNTGRPDGPGARDITTGEN